MAFPGCLEPMSSLWLVRLKVQAVHNNARLPPISLATNVADLVDFNAHADAFAGLRAFFRAETRLWALRTAKKSSPVAVHSAVFQ